MLPAETSRQRATFWTALAAASVLWLACVYALLPGCSTQRALPDLNPVIAKGLASTVYINNEMRGSGSGFVIASEKVPELEGIVPAGKWRTLVVTAGHCLEIGSPIHGQDAQGKSLGDSRARWRCPDSDLAILEFDTDWQVPAMALRPERIRAGEHVWLVGFPFGLPAQVTNGYVGDPREKDLDSYERNILAVYLFGDPGNSGSAVFDDNGEVVGVLVVGWHGSHGASGIVVLSPEEVSGWIEHVLRLKAPYWDIPGLTPWK